MAAHINASEQVKRSIDRSREMACQLRSISLPATRPNVLVQELEHELQRLRTSCPSPASASASSSPAAVLTVLGDAYSRIEELIGLPGSRRDGDALWRKAVEEALDASVALLDLCQLATDAVASVKQHVRAAQCARRRGDAGLFANTEVLRVLRCLTKVTKNASNAKKKVVSKRLLAQNEMPAAVKVLSEAMAITVAVLRGVVTSLYKRIVDTKKRRWLLVSRFLWNDWSHHSCKDLEGEGMAKDEEVLQGLEDNVVRLESGLEYLFRCLVQSRVALLNMLTL